MVTYYVCTIDQELSYTAVIGARTQTLAVYSPGGGTFLCVKLRHGLRLEIIPSNRKHDSVNRCE